MALGERHRVGGKGGAFDIKHREDRDGVAISVTIGEILLNPSKTPEPSAAAGATLGPKGKRILQTSQIGQGQSNPNDISTALVPLVVNYTNTHRASTPAC